MPLQCIVQQGLKRVRPLSYALFVCPSCVRFRFSTCRTAGQVWLASRRSAAKNGEDLLSVGLLKTNRSRSLLQQSSYFSYIQHFETMADNENDDDLVDYDEEEVRT